MHKNVVDTSADASMDEIYVTYDDEHVDDHDYDGTTDDDHDNNNETSGIAMLQPCFRDVSKMFKRYVKDVLRMF